MCTTGKNNGILNSRYSNENISNEQGDPMDAREFEILLSTCHDVASLFPDGVVFIGGIAVYLHAKNLPATADLAEFTHDADFYISIADMGDLRDIEEVTPNRRLSKHQMKKNGFEFDIYADRQSTLIVPYDAVAAASAVVGGIRIAALEHLLVLKLEAFSDRKDSAKGDKDAKDLIRIAAVAAWGKKRLRPERMAAYTTDTHLALLKRIEKGPHALSLARGNAMYAKKLRQTLSSAVAGLEHALKAKR
jgi:hypothetical protein